MAQKVTVKREELKVPTVDDPERMVYKIEYQVGELPPRFLFMAKADWTKEKEAEAIKADIERRMAPPSEVIEV